MIVAMIDWRLTIAWLTLAGLGGVSAAGVSGAVPASAPARATSHIASLPVELPLIVSHREADGLFYTSLDVNGQPIRFLIDTGSTHMVLGLQDARRLHNLDQAYRPADLATTGGMRAAHWVRVQEVTVDHTDIGPTDAVVTDRDLPASLLGQDVLARLGALRIDGDVLTLGPK